MTRTFPLALQPTQTGQRPTAAWLIPGEGPTQWLAEMANWEISLTHMRLLVLPQSITQPKASAALVLIDECVGSALRTEDSTVPKAVRGADPTSTLFSPTVLPYGVMAQRLYLPTHSRLSPEVSADELEHLLVHDILILHPSAGLIGFSKSDVVRAVDLIAPPRRRQETWNAARSIPQTAPRLLSVESDSPPTLAAILDSSRDDIGARGDETRDALNPTAPGSFALRITGPLNRLLEWMTRGMLGAAATGRTGLDRLEQARRSELNRLLEMLEKNPDQGLQYAIPLGQPAMRGLAPPSGKLSPRDMNFNLGRLRGAAPADPWNVPWQVRQRLLAQYRTAANRELTLGRHRRAAYIFAELLGDFTAAAHALRAGGHYREAASLFRDPLRNHLAAAECLAEGGMLAEAVALYEEIKQWIRAGEVYEKLERKEDARRCYRMVVYELVCRHELLSAAGILEKKLAAPSEALQVLTDAWPADDPSGLCLAESFELMGRLAKHGDAAMRVGVLVSQPPPARNVPGLAQALANVSRLYPDAAVRAAAADATRVVIGNHLVAHRVNTGETATLLASMTRLEPTDRLLARDVSRFSTKSPGRPIPYALAKPKAAQPTLLRSFHLPFAGWHTALSQGDLFYALGSTGDGQQLLRGNFQGDTQSINLFDCKRARLYLVPRRIAANMTIVSSGKTGEIHTISHIPANDSFALPLVVGRPSWLSPSGVHGLCFSEQDCAFVLENGENPCINGFVLPSGDLLQSWDLPDLTGTPYMAAQKGYVFIAAGQKYRQIADRQIQEIDLPHAATGIVASYAFTRLRIAIPMHEGVMVIWPDGGQQIIGEGLFLPVAAFLKSGTLVVISTDAGRAYRTGDGKAIHIASFPGSGQRPIALLPTEEPNTFAVMTADGTVKVHSADFDL
jgi:tetratricopeptide (TPR) repeat protein